MSVGLHGESAMEDVVHIDTTVDEKNITYPTDSKLAIKIINRPNKIGPAHGIHSGVLLSKKCSDWAWILGTTGT
ncbi:hypothetical protein [Nitrosomonas sp. wSCUT-2]